MCSPPTSSSPSIRNFTLIGSLPCCLKQPLHGLDQDDRSGLCRRPLRARRCCRCEWPAQRAAISIRPADRAAARHNGRKQQRRLTRRAQPFGVNQWIALALDQLRPGACPLSAVRSRTNSAALANVGLVLGQRADAGNAKESFQAFEIILVVLFVVVHAYFNPKRSEDEAELARVAGKCVVRFTSISISTLRASDELGRYRELQDRIACPGP